MPRVVIVRFLDVAASPRPNLRWTDRECDAWSLRCLEDDDRVRLRCRTVFSGLGIVALMIVGAMGVLAW